VRLKFEELWAGVQKAPKRYVRLWPHKSLTANLSNFDDLIRESKDATSLLERMREDGVSLDPKSSSANEYVYLVTSDPEVAKKYDMHDEKDFWRESVSDDDTTPVT